MTLLKAEHNGRHGDTPFFSAKNVFVSVQAKITATALHQVLYALILKGSSRVHRLSTPRQAMKVLLLLYLSLEQRLFYLQGCLG